MHRSIKLPEYMASRKDCTEIWCKTSRAWGAGSPLTHQQETLPPPESAGSYGVLRQRPSGQGLQLMSSDPDHPDWDYFDGLPIPHLQGLRLHVAADPGHLAASDQGGASLQPAGREPVDGQEAVTTDLVAVLRLADEVPPFEWVLL